MGDLLLDIAAFGERFARMSAAETAQYLEEAALGSVAGRAADEAAMLASAVWLTQRTGDGRVTSAREAARSGGLRIAELLLEDAAPYRALTPRARRPQPGPTSTDRSLLRGELGKYRTVTLRLGLRDRLVAAYVHPDADHTRRLLAMPALSVRDVVAMSARRPTTRELLVEVATFPRWIMRAEVREALVLNPFTPASIAVRFMPTLGVLRRVRGAVELDPRVREMARLLLGSVE